jgi:UDP-3-O-[3-hydroxymyristoyl] N-acetylglucosamine deacetylase
MEGIGIHTGTQSYITLKPAGVGHGIKFRSGSQTVEAIIENVLDTSRCTVLGKNDIMISTVEHLLAACSGLGITNLLVEINGTEIPIFDGSSLEFVKKLREAGIKEQDAKITAFEVKEYFCYREGESFILVTPSDHFSISTVVEFENPLVGMQVNVFTPEQENFDETVAPARTFAFREEVEHLLNSGLAKGGNLENAVIVDNDKYLNPLRFDDEIVRHKCLDLIGDLSLLGGVIKGHVYAYRPGHRTNVNFLRELLGKFDS